MQWGGGGRGAPRPALYDLSGTVHHIGASLKRGHYVAMVKGPPGGGHVLPMASPAKQARGGGAQGQGAGAAGQQGLEACPWYRHDDASVSEVGEGDVFGPRGQSSVYLLCYTLRTE